jgi:hypothetical protein
VGSAEVVHATDQVHQRFERLWATQQRMRTPHQDSQARAKGGIQPFDEGGVEL